MRITNNPINNYSTMNRKYTQDGSSFNATKDFFSSEINQISKNK